MFHCYYIQQPFFNVAVRSFNNIFCPVSFIIFSIIAIICFVGILNFCYAVYHHFFLLLHYKVDHHPKMTRYAAENYSIREENRLLRSLESLMKAEEVATQISAELEEAFQRALESEKLTGSKIVIIVK